VPRGGVDTSEIFKDPEPGTYTCTVVVDPYPPPMSAMAGDVPGHRAAPGRWQAGMYGTQGAGDVGEATPLCGCLGVNCD
jgi:hypothetical protein